MEPQHYSKHFCNIYNVILRKLELKQNIGLNYRSILKLKRHFLWEKINYFAASLSAVALSFLKEWQLQKSGRTPINHACFLGFF